jgi:DNA-binding MarR family transcriptional regulator
VSFPHQRHRSPQYKKPTKQPGTAKRLKLQEVNELIAAYQAGTNVYELGERFGVTRQTVSAILKRHGVRTRWNRRSTKRVR